MTIQEYISLISREPLTIEQGKGYRYIKKSILQKELLFIYEGHTRWEMLRDTISKNGLWGTGILEIKHPVSGEWLHYTGTASLPHERKMRLNYPNLEAHCFINACKKIGVWFGQTLNIDEEDAMPEDNEAPEINREDERLEILIDQCPNIETLAKYKDKLTESTRPVYVKKLKELTKQNKAA